jgi:hypothetical protein
MGHGIGHRMSCCRRLRDDQVDHQLAGGFRGARAPLYYPPFLRSFGIKDLGGGHRQVFGFKGLAGKVFKNQ